MSYSINDYGVKIDIDLLPGTYVFVPNSAIGKSYLATLFDRYVTYGEAVCAYTFTDYTQGVNLREVITSGRYSVILLDRYDMYYGEALKELQNPPANTIILVDTKRPELSMRPKGFCAIARREGRVCVA